MERKNFAALLLGLLAGALIAFAKELGLIPQRVMCHVERVDIDTPIGVVVHTTKGQFVTRDLSAGNVALHAVGAPVLILYRERHGHNHASSIGRGLQQPSTLVA